MGNNQSLTPFNFEGHEIRTIIIDGELWWVLADVCEALEIDNYRNVASRLDDDEKGVHTVDTPGGKQQMLCTNEPGIYHVTRSSRKPEAQRLRRWVDHEVLPSIRKTGSYSIGQEQPQPQLPGPDTVTYSDAALDHIAREVRRVQYYRKQQAQSERRLRRLALHPDTVLEDEPVIDAVTPEVYASALEQEIVRQLVRFKERKNRGMSVTDLQNYMKRFSQAEIKRGCHNLIKIGVLEVERTPHTVRYQLLQHMEIIDGTN